MMVAKRKLNIKKNQNSERDERPLKSKYFSWKQISTAVEGFIIFEGLEREDLTGNFDRYVSRSSIWEKLTEEVFLIDYTASSHGEERANFERSNEVRTHFLTTGRPFPSLKLPVRIMMKSIRAQIPHPPKVMSFKTPVPILPVMKWSTPNAPKKKETSTNTNQSWSDVIPCAGIPCCVPCGCME